MPSLTDPTSALLGFCAAPSKPSTGLEFIAPDAVSTPSVLLTKLGGHWLHGRAVSIDLPGAPLLLCFSPVEFQDQFLTSSIIP